MKKIERYRKFVREDAPVGEVRMGLQRNGRQKRTAFRLRQQSVAGGFLSGLKS
jgi:hypothetical protein